MHCCFSSKCILCLIKIHKTNFCSASNTLRAVLSRTSPSLNTAKGQKWQPLSSAKRVCVHKPKAVCPTSPQHGLAHEWAVQSVCSLSVINPLNVALRYTNTSANSQPDADPLPSGKFRSALMPLVSRAHGCSTTTASKSISWEREEGWGNSAPCHSIFTSEEMQFKMNRRKVNTGAAAASSFSQLFLFPVLARMDWCLFIRGRFQKGGLRCWDTCRVGACARSRCRFKKKPFFFRLLCFPSRSNRGAVLLRWASGRCGFTACSHTRRALCTGKSPRRRPTFTNEVKERNRHRWAPISANRCCWKTKNNIWKIYKLITIIKLIKI